MRVPNNNTRQRRGSSVQVRYPTMLREDGRYEPIPAAGVDSVDAQQLLMGQRPPET